MSRNEELIRRAQEYAQQRGMVLGEHIGSGVHGIVFATESQHENAPSPVRSAVKVHEHEADYRRERDVYLRLQEHGITAIRGCHVPRLLAFDDQRWVIEMTVVSRPFVLDFAGAYLDLPPDFTEEVIAEWRQEKQEQFGARWADVQAVLRLLEGYGVFLVDVHPGNISFGD
jgi:hypothetical protein